jgi:hypothetical protein
MNARHLNSLTPEEISTRLLQAGRQTDRNGRALARVLSESTQLASDHTQQHAVAERLRAARERAVAARKRSFAEAPAYNPAASAGFWVWVQQTLGLRPAVAVQGLGGFGALHTQTQSQTQSNDNDGLGWASGIASVIPAVALVAALVFIHDAATEERATELAAVDAELLADDLPPSAYADPGFAAFLKQQTR